MDKKQVKYYNVYSATDYGPGRGIIGGHINSWPLTKEKAEKLAAQEKKNPNACKVEVREITDPHWIKMAEYMNRGSK